MAIAMTAAITGTYLKTWTITALDADAATSILHGITGTPGFLWFTPGIVFASTATPSFAVTANATTLFVNKSVNAGSGGLTAGTTVIGTIGAWTPHSIIV